MTKTCSDLQIAILKDRVGYKNPNFKHGSSGSKEYIAEKGSRSYLKNKDKYRKSRYAKLGVTVEDYDIMLKTQNGVCAICESEGDGRRLAIDHCHKTGKVRGLLCWKCNIKLPVYDDLEWKGKAEAYLSSYVLK